ncbi:MAG: hypothetical protein FWF08_09410 [Oscillospiraceae bacterium]|nr:hypothetical protein [Oscillospiraceae bacterium]
MTQANKTKELPKRKKLRLKNYNYSQNGYYFITICTNERCKILGEITLVGRDAPGAPLNTPSVFVNDNFYKTSLRLSKYGETVSKEIQETPNHYEGVVIEKFVVMPNHIHMIITVNRENGAPGASRPTNAMIPIIIAGLKKKTNKITGLPLWQTSYYDHIIRNENEYWKIWEYIDTNPLRWVYDKYYI